MNKILIGFIAIGLLTFIGCKKEEDTETTDSPETNSDTSSDDNNKESENFNVSFSSIIKSGSMYTISLCKENLNEIIVMTVFSQKGETLLYTDTSDFPVLHPSGGYTITENNVITNYVSTAIVHDSLFIGSTIALFAPIGQQRPIKWDIVIDNNTATITGSFDAYNSSLNDIMQIDFFAEKIPLTVMQ